MPDKKIIYLTQGDVYYEVLVQGHHVIRILSYDGPHEQRPIQVSTEDLSDELLTQLTEKIGH